MINGCAATVTTVLSPAGQSRHQAPCQLTRQGSHLVLPNTPTSHGLLNEGVSPVRDPHP